MTAYLEFLINELISVQKVQIITPRDPNQRGCQLSLLFLEQGQMPATFEKLSKAGIICDQRKPDVLRIAPAPLYNSFQDVWHFVNILSDSLQKAAGV